MDDRRSLFLIAVGDLCTTAELGSLVVELRTRDGTTVLGVPGPTWPTIDGEAGESGYDRRMIVDERVVDLTEVVACTVRVPDPGGFDQA